jgi:hypothetical protein
LKSYPPPYGSPLPLTTRKKIPVDSAAEPRQYSQ